MIQIENISKDFYRKKALNDVSFTIEPGKIFGLLGPNGAGKTTLIRILTGIIQPTTGNITIEGKKINQEHFKTMGYLPEERGLYPNMRVDQQVAFFASLKGLNKKEIAENLAVWQEKLEIGDWIHKPVHQLSKGMAQKIQFLISVIHNPNIIILDEPFSGFDPINQKLIEKIIFEMRDDGKYIILSTHNMNAVENICETVGLMNDGQKILQDQTFTLQNEISKGVFSIEFEGNILAFTHALWTGYNLVDKKQHGDNHFTAYIEMKRDNQFHNLVEAVKEEVKIISIQPVKASMQEIYVNQISNKEEHAQ